MIEWIPKNDKDITWIDKRMQIESAPYSVLLRGTPSCGYVVFRVWPGAPSVLRLWSVPPSLRVYWSVFYWMPLSPVCCNRSSLKHLQIIKFNLLRMCFCFYQSLPQNKWKLKRETQLKPSNNNIDRRKVKEARCSA